MLQSPQSPICHSQCMVLLHARTLTGAVPGSPWCGASALNLTPTPANGRSSTFQYLSNLILLNLTIWVLYQPEEFGASYFPCLVRVSGFQQRCNSHPPTCPHSFSASFSFCQPVVIVTNGPGCHCKCQLKHSRSRSFSLTTNSGSVWARAGPNPYRKIWLTLRTHGTEPCHELRIQLGTH